MFKNNLFITSIVILLLFSCNVFAVTKNEATLLDKQIQDSIDKNRIQYQIPALSLSIKLSNEPIPRNYVSGNDSSSSNKKITPDTLFQIGSITKTFTATIVFKLVEEKKLNLHQSINHWLPQYSKWKTITVENLLNHTSGIADYTHGDEFDRLLRDNPDQSFSLSQLADIAYQQPNLSKPGLKYHYTNTDYILLGMIIEKVTNQSLQEIFNDYLHQYHLDNTFYAPNGYSNTIKNRIAHGYNRDATFEYGKDVTFMYLSFLQSSGAMISTPNDIVRWLNLLFSGKIITNQSLNKMTSILSEVNAKSLDIKKIARPHLLQNKSFIEIGSGAGIGLIYFKDYGYTWVHAGGTPGYEAFYAYNPCHGIYLALMYDIKPKKQLIFIKIAEDIFSILNHAQPADASAICEKARVSLL